MKSFSLIIKYLAAAFAAVCFSLPRPALAGVDPWGAAAQALGVYMAYKSSLAGVLELGNSPAAQVMCRVQDMRENGLDPNAHDRALVDSVMERLVADGEYALKVNNLPFTWRVNDSADFNAACYPTNYVSVNRALVRGLQCEEDELAAVLAHEMTHGLLQHSAHNYAQAVAQFYGMSFLNMDAGLMDWNKLTALASFSIAKNVTLPAEYEADEGGFYLAASAGFNPGGGAAAMARMNYYLTYETRNVLEHQGTGELARDESAENFNDHPETELREKRLAQIMSDYGAGHVTSDGESVFVEGEKLFTCDWTREDYDNTKENAYYAAGALAKAFHDFDSIEAWDFRDEGEGVVCLEENRVNAALQEFLLKTGTGERLRSLVAKAYAGEAASGAREKLRAAEAARSAEWAKVREEAQGADAKAVKRLRENADVYSDYGEGRLALFEMERCFSAANQDDLAESYGIRGRAKAVVGDYAGALADSDEAVRLDGKNIYNYLNRADVHLMRGDRASALADVASAKELEPKTPVVYLMEGSVYDEMANKEAALAAYQEFYKLAPKGVRRIPEEYMKEVAPKEYEKLMKARAEREKEKAKEEAKKD